MSARLGPRLSFGVSVLIAVAALGAYSTTAIGQSPAQSGPAPSGAAGEITFTKHIAPILQRSCQRCHRPGSVAPMSLLTYEDVRPWARAIRQRVVAREMPPWHIVRNVGITKFKNDPSLSDAEIATMAKWVDGGAPRGNPADMPQPLQFKEWGEEEWGMGKPDVIVSLDKPYLMSADGPDQYLNILVDPGFTKDMWVSAAEVRPADAKSFAVVHHLSANIVTDPENDPIGPQFTTYGNGQNPEMFPAGSGRFIPKGSLVNFNIHVSNLTIDKDVPANVEFGLKLFPEGTVPKYEQVTVSAGTVTNELDIPPGEVTRFDGYFRLNKPALLHSFHPHIHNRGRAQCLQAVYFDDRSGRARTETLSCADWHFAWHLTYAYADDVAPLLPAGTVIKVMTWYDNTANNKGNPDPRNWTGSGSRSVDEMGFSRIMLIYLEEGDFKERVAARRKLQGPVMTSRVAPQE